MASFEDYLDTPEAFEALSDEDKVTLFNGGTLEGETSQEEISDTPAADETKQEAEAKEEEKESAADPVLLAKDGKHTIPFEELTSARARAAELEQLAKQQSELIESLKGQKQAVQEEQKPEPATDSKIDALEQEYANKLYEGNTAEAAAIRKQINAAILEQARGSVRAEIKQESDANQQERSINEAADKAAKDYPFLDSNSKEANPEAISDVIAMRDGLIAQGIAPDKAIAQAAAKVAKIYAPVPAPTQDEPKNTLAEAKKAADAAIAKAKPKVPTSLSEVPAAGKVVTDEVEAIRDMSDRNLMQMLEGKTPKQINEIMSRVL